MKRKWKKERKGKEKMKEWERKRRNSEKEKDEKFSRNLTESYNKLAEFLPKDYMTKEIILTS
ncbi:hypothetical protein RhiirA4_488865 [Rhizophagus irregularis]|uniref:Uncharacterized protein n=1 Tax=Rhizophagus irregularis TaxID=588596 RepID=A0A2I1HUA1_9GLOM|nr:hypothetical protein RhiirA4_488865 [Rhizophagus irregularis]